MKLVRDKIPDIIMAEGKSVKVHRCMDEKEGMELLWAKLQEEVKEFFDDPSVEEACDVMTVMMALLDCSWGDIEQEAIRKQKERGGFDKFYVLEETE